MMLSFLPPSTLIRCEDLASCFQNLYNFLFMILLTLAFVWFVYGAFQYLLSGGGIFKKEEGKKKMINSIVAIIVVLLIPSVLQLINPEIFSGIKLQIPQVTVISPKISLEAVETSERNVNDNYIVRSPNNFYRGHSFTPSYVGGATTYLEDWKWENVFGSKEALSNVRIVGNDKDGTEYINPKMREKIIAFNEALKNKGLYVLITDGYSPNDHASRDHTFYGTAFDVVVTKSDFKTIAPPNDWEEVKKIALDYFNVLDERAQGGSVYWSGAHFHFYVKVR